MDTIFEQAFQELKKREDYLSLEDMVKNIPVNDYRQYQEIETSLQYYIKKNEHLFEQILKNKMKNIFLEYEDFIYKLEDHKLMIYEETSSALTLSELKIQGSKKEEPLIILENSTCFIYRISKERQVVLKNILSNKLSNCRWSIKRVYSDITELQTQEQRLKQKNSFFLKKEKDIERKKQYLKNELADSNKRLADLQENLKLLEMIDLDTIFSNYHQLQDILYEALCESYPYKKVEIEKKEEE